MLIVIDADAISVQVNQVSPNATANIQCEARLQTAKMPTIRCLDIKYLLPPGRLLNKQPVGIAPIPRADVFDRVCVLRSCSQFISVRGSIVSEIGIFRALTQQELT